MKTKQEIARFIKGSEYALEHIYEALSKYYQVLKKNTDKLKELDDQQKLLSDLFIQRDQWSSDANYHYIRFMQNVETISGIKEGLENSLELRVKEILSNSSATLESMSYLGTPILQIAKQILSMTFSSKPSIPSARMIGSQNIVDIIWEGRNHVMHWEEKNPRNEKVKQMFRRLRDDFGYEIEFGKNNCLVILDALEWHDKQSVIDDLKTLVLS